VDSEECEGDVRPEERDVIDIEPGVIRSLRGSLSRAAFARIIGVTPLTIYRWELPAGAPQARRPRGAWLGRLRELAQPELSGSKAVVAASTEETERVLSLSEALFGADWKHAELTLIALLLQSNELASVDARILASSLLVLSYLVHGSFSPSALVALITLLRTRDAICARTRAYVESIVALAVSTIGGKLRELDRIQALAAGPSWQARSNAEEKPCFLAALALVNTAIQSNDAELLEFGLDRYPCASPKGMERLFSVWSNEVEGLKALNAGRLVEARGCFERLNEEAELGGLCFLQHRASGHLARIEAIEHTNQCHGAQEPAHGVAGERA
jgi:hypothetical protein